MVLLVIAFKSYFEFLKAKSKWSTFGERVVLRAFIAFYISKKHFSKNLSLYVFTTLKVVFYFFKNYIFN